MRTSSYTIYVDLPGDERDMLLVHGYSGAYDKVSRRVGDYLRSRETGRVPKPLYGAWSPEPTVDGEIAAPSDETIALLRRRGYLTELDTDAETAYFTRVAELVHKAGTRMSYIFMPTYDCNLRCSYCFQDHMRTDPSYSGLLRTMSPRVIDRILASFDHIETRHGLPVGPENRASMGFFGGEPLLAANRESVEYIVTSAQAANPDTTFWAITNGTDLHHYCELLGPRAINALQITFDGPPGEHDRRRVHADGSGSFDRIAENLTAALEAGVQVSVRMNIDRANVELLPALAEEFVARGWDRWPTFAAQTAPIQAANDKTDRATTFGSWALDRAIDRLREEHDAMRIIQRPDDALGERIRSIFSTGGLPSMHASYCGAHTGMYLFDAFGDIYTCWERTGDQRVRVGHIDDDGVPTFNEFVAKWQSRTVTSNATCRRCRYALYCGGGCAILAEEQRGEFYTNFCDGYAARFRATAAEAYLSHTRKELPLVAVRSGCDH